MPEPTWGSAEHHERYLLPMPDRRFRKCRYEVDGDDCGQKITHRGMANGVCLTAGCEWHARRWVREQDQAALARYRATGDLADPTADP